ncbi:MAG: hypothetical protein P9X22_08110 [Candidatus Zapsychrus exili]|nr:hypothetical protein [Candidatus Zapsychrus exili]
MRIEFYVVGFLIALILLKLIVSNCRKFFAFVFYAVSGLLMLLMGTYLWWVVTSEEVLGERFGRENVVTDFGLMPSDIIVKIRQAKKQKAGAGYIRSTETGRHSRREFLEREKNIKREAEWQKKKDEWLKRKIVKGLDS